MKFTCDIIINKPIDLVTNYWIDESKFNKWQSGFKSISTIKGNKNETNSVREIILIEGKNKMTLTETVLLNDLPTIWKTFVHHKHMDNLQTVSFTLLDKNSTKVSSEIDYVAFHSFIPKMMAKVFPGMFKRQVQSWLMAFKNMLEENI